MNPNLPANSAAQLRAAIGATRQRPTEMASGICDVANRRELLTGAELELTKPLPGAATLAVPLNSVARSLAAIPTTRQATLTLDAAMREAATTARAPSPTSQRHGRGFCWELAAVAAAMFIGVGPCTRAPLECRSFMLRGPRHADGKLARRQQHEEIGKDTASS
jgi:hypothetical protein